MSPPGRISGSLVAHLCSWSVLRLSETSLSLYTYGFDFDMPPTTTSASGPPATARTVRWTPSVGDIDFKGWLLAVGGNVMLGRSTLHGQSSTPRVTMTPTTKWNRSTRSGLPLLVGNHGSTVPLTTVRLAGSPGDKISNMIIFGTSAPIHETHGQADDSARLWYASAGRRRSQPVKKTNWAPKLDMKVTYQLVEGLNLDLIGAYLLAGDATSNSPATTKMILRIRCSAEPQLLSDSRHISNSPAMVQAAIARPDRHITFLP